MPRNKEEIYDEDINPLMAQIIEICKANNIGMFFTACIPTEADAGLMCTTRLPANAADESKPSNDVTGDELTDKFVQMLERLRRREGPVMHMTQTNPDGSKVLTAILP